MYIIWFPRKCRVVAELNDPLQYNNIEKPRPLKYLYKYTLYCLTTHKNVTHILKCTNGRKLESLLKLAC